jgi:hypothetical protein
LAMVPFRATVAAARVGFFAELDFVRERTDVFLMASVQTLQNVIAPSLHAALFSAHLAAIWPDRYS